MSSQTREQIYYEEVLRQVALENGFIDPRFDFEAGCKKGDNVVAKLVRCTVADKTGGTRKLHFMVKLAPDNEIQRARFRVKECFDIEAKMYGEVLPALADVMKRKGLLKMNDVFPCTARTHALRSEGEDMVIVMEDLKQRGYIMTDRKIGLDERHCRLVLQKLALLHAASLALQKENPQRHEELVGQLKEVIFAGKVPPTFIKAMEYSRSYIDGRFPVGTIEREKFEQYAERNSEILLSAVKRNSTFCCITHGDLTVNNILFKYKPGSTEPEDVCFVDLQLSRMASPILDLSYLFCLCTRKDTRKSFPGLVKVYYECLSKSLSDLGHDPGSIIPWNSFQEELRKYFNFGWGSAVKMLSSFLLDEDEINEYENQFSQNKPEGYLVRPKNAGYLKTVLSDLLEDLVMISQRQIIVRVLPEEQFKVDVNVALVFTSRQYEHQHRRVNMKPKCVPDHVQIMLDQLASENGFKKPRYECSGGSEQGDNYVGQVYRVVLHDDGNNSKEKLHLIVKCAPANAKRRELLRTNNLFENEIYVYKTVLPELLRVLKQKGIVSKSHPTFPATPKLFATRTSTCGEEHSLIMKDMAADGFKMADRFAGMDAEHCRLILRELARLHATSIMLKIDNPDTHSRISESFQETVCVPEWKPSFKAFADRARPMIDARFPEGTVGRAKFEDFVSKYFEIMEEVSRPDPRLAVFCHGDTWVNNFLFKYEKGSSVPEAACLIDFQLARYSTPVTDMAYMFFCSTTKSTRDKHYKQLLIDYHRFLCSFLKTLGCLEEKIISWDVMQDMYRKYMKFGLGMAIITIPIFLSKQGDVYGVDEVGDATKLDEMFITKTESNPARDARLSDVLQDMIEYGYI